tara:strand:+ start:178 stop:507 length:330 start_codon:yes stop_codon:yes gene_type:complete
MPFCSACDTSYDSAWEICPECIWRGIRDNNVDCIILDDDECRQCSNSSVPQLETGTNYGSPRIPIKLLEKGPKKKCCEKRLKKSKMCKRCPHWLETGNIEVTKLLILSE